MTAQEQHLEQIRTKSIYKASLEREYLANPNWTTLKTAEIAQQLGVNFKKVYKWNWERKRKDRNNMAEWSPIIKFAKNKLQIANEPNNLNKMVRYLASFTSAKQAYCDYQNLSSLLLTISI